MVAGMVGGFGPPLLAADTVAVPENLLLGVAMFALTSTVALIAYIVRTQFKHAQLLATITVELRTIQVEQAHTEKRLSTVETAQASAMGRLTAQERGPWPQQRKENP